MMLAVMTVIFILLCVVTGGDRTAKSIVSLMLCALVMVLCIAAMYILPFPLASGTACVVLVTLISTLFQNEKNEKSMTALFAVFLTAALMAALVFIFVYKGHLAGMADTGQAYVRESNGFEGNIGINMVFVEVSVILITLTGAVTDIAIAVVSGVDEVAENSKDPKIYELFGSGMRIGADILSSTVNTLFFVFAGEYLLLFVNFMTYYSFSEMINSKEFSQGAVSIALSAIGCVAAIPIAAAMASKRFAVKREADEK